MLYGIVVSIPTIIIAGPIFSRTLKKIESKPLETFKPPDLKPEELPGVANSFLTALLPVILFALMTLLPLIISSQYEDHNPKYNQTNASLEQLKVMLHNQFHRQLVLSSGLVVHIHCHEGQ